jgi:hypothetical protein
MIAADEEVDPTSATPVVGVEDVRRHHRDGG